MTAATQAPCGRIPCPPILLWIGSLTLLMMAAGSPAETATAPEREPSPNTSETPAWLKSMGQSIGGDVYSHPEEWQPLSYDDLFSKGWDQAWVSPPAGAGGAPRQGWLLALGGIFNRLSVGVFGWQAHQAGSEAGLSGTLISFTPLNQRLNIQTDLPWETQGAHPSDQPHSSGFGDVRIQPRLLLSESVSLTQSLNLSFRTPTGDSRLGNGWASVAPRYEFWSNPWQGMVIRGGTGFTLPYAGAIQAAKARATFDATVAIGYYFTPHHYAPLLGDLVGYVVTNLTQVIDHRGDQAPTLLSVGPGFRTHLADDWYLLGAVEVPLTRPSPFNYQVLGGLMKVY